MFFWGALFVGTTCWNLQKDILVHYHRYYHFYFYCPQNNIVQYKQTEIIITSIGYEGILYIKHWSWD